MQKTRWPTKKWWAAAFSGGFTILAHAFGSGGWDSTESAELMTLAAGLVSAYSTLNDQTLGGVPMKEITEGPDTRPT